MDKKSNCADCRGVFKSTELNRTRNGSFVCDDCYSSVNIKKQMTPKRRTCLKCGQLFRSNSIKNRICFNCKPREGEAFGNVTVFYGG